MSDQELKPCPFCGGEAEFERVGTSRYSTIVRCTNCGTSLESGETWDHGSQWNTRTPDPMLEELAECLGEILPMVANACDERRYENALQSLQKYQQSKVQP